MGAFQYGGLTLTGKGEARSIRGLSATAEYFALLGMQPLLGRLFTDRDDQPSAAPTIVLNHRFWSERPRRRPADRRRHPDSGRARVRGRRRRSSCLGDAPRRLLHGARQASRRATGAPRRSGAGRRGPRERRRWGVRRGEAPRSRSERDQPGSAWLDPRPRPSQAWRHAAGRAGRSRRDHAASGRGRSRPRGRASQLRRDPGRARHRERARGARRADGRGRVSSCSSHARMSRACSWQGARRAPANSRSAAQSAPAADGWFVNCSSRTSWCPRLEAPLACSWPSGRFACFFRWRRRAFRGWRKRRSTCPCSSLRPYSPSRPGFSSAWPRS